MKRRTVKLIDKCACKGTAKKQLVAVAGCSDDLAAVTALPQQWIPRHCGSTLTNYLKERETNHEKILEDLTRDATIVNKDIDAEIRAIAEMLLSHIQENQKEIDCVIKKSQRNEGVLSAEDRNKAFKEITDLHARRTQDFINFKQEALAFERQRADGIRNVLQSQFQCLIAIGHKTPKDLLHEFDERIYEINQQLLSNFRAYIELEAQLREQLDENVVHARSALNQLCLKQSTNVVRRQSASPRAQRKSLFSQIRPDSADEKHEPDDFSHQVIYDIEKFKSCVSKLVEAYDSSILNLFNGFLCQLDDLHKHIGFNNLRKDKNTKCSTASELQNIIESALAYISSSNTQVKSSIYKDLEEMVRNDVLNMRRSLSRLGNRLNDTYMVLNDSAHLWDDHMLRCTNAQRMIVAAVEDMQNTYDTMELANEINFNVTLEQLRCSPDVDKLQQNFEIAMNLLERTSEIYLQNSKIEIAKIQEYMNLSSIMANILISQCNYFLENHPKTVTEPPKSVTSSANVESPNANTTFSRRAPLPRAILQTQLQEVALNNWKNIFLDSFENNLSTISDKLNRQAQKWINERILQLNMRYSLKMMSHSIRAERVKAAREMRLIELRFHESRLNSHLEAMHKLINGLPLNASIFLALDAPELYPFCKWIESIQTDMDNLLAREPLDPEIKRLKMSSYAPRLVKHRKMFQDSLDSATERYKKNIEYEIHAARISNYRFMSQLKLFIVGGRFAAPEATKTCAALNKAADSLELCLHRSIDALHHRRSLLLALADQHMLPLQRIVDEVYKHGAKDALDKKKPPPKKKK